jgi:hypothetical protein
VIFDKNPRETKKASKWPEIPILDDYGKYPSACFWEKFPKRQLPEGHETKIDVEQLDYRIESNKSKMTVHQYERSKKAVDYLRNGAPSFQKKVLPGCFEKNSNSTVKNGQEVTEAIATWIKEGYAAGPFDSPPYPNFRVNPIMAVVQPGKVRPVLDVSSPKEESYNSCVDENETETVKMASARLYSQLLLDCGKEAVMSKHDIVAAYKQIPCKTEDLRLQGFCWLGKYFVETRLIFGAKTSVSNYDIIGETLKLLAVIESGVPPCMIMRQVDDVPVAAPKDSGLCEKFSETYKNVCADCNVELAPDCPLNDKAFTNETRGKVLGVMFDSSDLTWRLSDKKVTNAKNCIKNALKNSETTLKEWQRLIGRLNDVGLMCPFLKCYKLSINQCIADIPSDAEPGTIVKISDNAKKDLLVWAGFLCSPFKWLPIYRKLHAAPVWHKEFVSDAAGLSEKDDIWKKPGCGCVGFAENGTIIFANQLTWPKSFIVNACDGKEVRYGDKTTT